MTSFRAVTETGTVWEYRGGIMHIDSQRWGKSAFMPWVMKVVDRSGLTEVETKRELFEILHALPDFEGLPEVGKNLYAAGRDEWRLSTAIVTVEELADE